MAENKTDDLLTLLKSRLTVGKAFATDWQKDVKKWLKDYKIESLDDIDFVDLYNKIQVPYIFSTVESGLPSIFERIPSLVMMQRGHEDKEFTLFADTIWEYITDKIGLEEKIQDLGLDFLITGMGFGKWGWNTQLIEVADPQTVPLSDSSGQVLAETVIENMITVPIKDEPTFSVCNYKDIYFSPESIFTIDDTENKIPFIIYKTTMTKEEAKELYGKKITNRDCQDINYQELAVSSKEVHSFDLKRVVAYEYYGILPKALSKDENWRYNRDYHVVFTSDQELLEPTPIDKKPILLVGNYGSSHDFYKFGEPKILRELEQDISLGRSRMMDYRDKFGTKIAIPNATEVDEQALKRPADATIMRVIGNAYPQYITPPPYPETLISGIGMSKEDIQMTSAQLDISRGGTQSIVTTATGQRIFEAATEKRINRKRQKIARFIRALAKNLLVLCAENWDVDEFSLITDIPQEEIQEKQYIEKMKRIGEDYDILIEVESVLINKETQSAQAIALYREVKDDPLVNRQEVLKNALRIGFGERNVDKYLNVTVTPDQIMQVLEYLATNEIIPMEVAGQIAQSLGELSPTDDGSPLTKMGRPPSADPTTIMKNRMPQADGNQIAAQNQASFQQQGVTRGPQGI